VGHFGVFSVSLSLLGTLAEHEFLLELLEELGGSLDIDEEGVNLSDIGNVHLGGLPLLGDQVGGGDEMD